MIKKKCEVCGSELTKKQIQHRQSAKYCSKKCYGVSKMGFIPWNKGTKGIMKLNRTSFQKGIIPWNKGTKGIIKAWNKGLRGIHYSLKTEFQKGIIPWNKGLKETCKHTEEWKEQLSQKMRGKNHPNWMGGISDKPYPSIFNNRLKLIIRQRDNYTCQECNYTEEQLEYKLPVHHIDYDKENNNLNNLISLCRSCHAKTNFKREDWIKYFGEFRYQGTE